MAEVELEMAWLSRAAWKREPAYNDFCAAVKCSANLSTATPWGRQGNDFVRILDLRQVKPKGVLKHHQAGHGLVDHLRSILSSTQSQVSCCA